MKFIIVLVFLPCFFAAPRKLTNLGDNNNSNSLQDFGLGPSPPIYTTTNSEPIPTYGFPSEPVASGYLPASEPGSGYLPGSISTSFTPPSRQDTFSSSAGFGRPFIPPTSSPFSSRVRPFTILNSEYNSPEGADQAWNYRYSTENGIEQEAEGRLVNLGKDQVYYTVIRLQKF